MTTYNISFKTIVFSVVLQAHSKLFSIAYQITLKKLGIDLGRKLAFIGYCIVGNFGKH